MPAACGWKWNPAASAKSCTRTAWLAQMAPRAEWRGARIPVYRGWVPVRRQVGNGEVYLVGDAAAQVKVSTVGGIVTGFRGALGVSEALLQNGKSRELAALRRELGTHWLIRRAL